MKLLDKFKESFKKKLKFKPNQKTLTNSADIQKFFNKTSGWRKTYLGYHYCPITNCIKANASFSREATEKEKREHEENKLQTTYEFNREKQTLDSVWNDAIQEMENSQKKIHTREKFKDDLDSKFFDSPKIERVVE